MARRTSTAVVVAYGWALAFLVVPLALVLKMSLSRSELAQPPYAPVFTGHESWSEIVEKLGMFSVEAYRGIVADTLYLQSFLTSVELAALATLVTLLFAFPFAQAIAEAPPHRRAILYGFAVAPFWTSFLIRVYALSFLIKNDGPFEHLLVTLRIIDPPLDLVASNAAVVIGIAYSYLPFMILPLVNALERRDPALREAARDLGATPFVAFGTVTVPSLVPGILAGCLLVFIPATGEFVIPDLLGGSDTLMIGRTLWNDFFANRDWPTAAAAATILLACLLGPIWWAERRAERVGHVA